jgi:uncharacterized protein YfaT (DUF1175 family)
MPISDQMRAPSKRSVTMLSIVLVLLAALGWGFTRLLAHARGFTAARGAVSEQAAATKPKTAKDPGGIKPANAAEPGATLVDSDNDGIPDAAELHTFQDRDNFRRWFTAIAETQFYQLSDQWNGEQRDCAGLVRFAMREALRHHDRIWFQKMGPGYETVAPDVAGFDLSQNPLGEKIFRTDFGSFHESDLRNGRFSEFADGRSLKNFNSVFVSRDRREAQPGDLLFFYQPWVQKFPYHVMVMLGSPHIAPNGAQDWVVYHTGSSPTDRGAVKKVQLAVLDHHPDPRWRPVESNKNFLGFYRLKILN